jgi:hypothetical protein
VGGTWASSVCSPPIPPTPEDRATIATVAEVIAHGLDRIQEITTTARIVEAAGSGVLLTRGGDTLPLLP